MAQKIGCGNEIMLSKMGQANQKWQEKLYICDQWIIKNNNVNQKWQNKWNICE